MPPVLKAIIIVFAVALGAGLISEYGKPYDAPDPIVVHPVQKPLVDDSVIFCTLQVVTCDGTTVRKDVVTLPTDPLR